MASSSYRTFADPEAFWPAIRARQVQGVVTARGQFRAELTRVDFDRLLMQRVSENLARVLDASIHAERVGLVFLPDQGQSVKIGGMTLAPAEIVKVDSEAGSHHRSAGPLQWSGISMTHEDLAHAGEAVVGRALAPPTFLQHFKPAARLFARLRNLHEAVAHLAKTAPDVLALPEVSRAMEEALVEAMVRCLASGKPADVRSAQARGARVMRRLEEALRANPNRALYTTELCAFVGVSYPTLRACCQEHLGISPKRYLWLRRMHLARRALRETEAGRKTVTEIATDYGFWELGRFSVTYHALFGEPPSVTLRRRPDELRLGESAAPPEKFAISA
jgi:AraC-like DNA-binding protein